MSNVIQFVPAVRPASRPPSDPWVFEKRLMDRCEVDDNGCWLWQGPTMPNGYGQINAWGKVWLIHRLAHALMVGAIPADRQVDHVCRARNCVSPFHLEAVTQAENLRRQAAAVIACPAGHLYTPANTYRAPSAPRQRRCRECTRIRNRAVAA